MTVPTFIGAGAGAAITGASGNVSKAGCTVGNIIIVQALADGTNGVVLFGSPSGVESLIGTDNALTPVPHGASGSGDNNFEVGSPTAAIQRLWIGRAILTTVTVGLAGNAGDDVYALVYEFSGVHAGTLTTDVYENVNAGDTINGVGTSTTILDTTVTTLATDRLACNFIGVNDDNALGDFTGETGGDWTLVASFASATGTDGAIGLETASMAAAGTIDGGTFVMVASDGWGVAGLALIPSVVAAADAPYPYVGGGYHPTS